MADRIIRQPYLLILNLALRRRDGRLWADPLWHKDLFRHLDEIDHLTLFCPVEGAPPPDDWLDCTHPRLAIVTTAAMGRSGWLRMPALALALWRAIGAARIVHTGVAGWPFPLGWIAVPIARMRCRFLVIVVESSFWRVAAGEKSIARRAKARLFETLNRACVNACDISFFTTEAYSRDLATRPRGPAIVAPASWIDEVAILPLKASPNAGGTHAGRLLYAGRLIAAKGVDTLLRAVEVSSAPIDIIGSGDLAPECAAIAARSGGRVRVLAPVPYGPEFFSLLDAYDAVIVPSVSDEQPRIIFDAFARALPVIATATPGHVGLVRAGETGWLVPPGDAPTLAAAMNDAIASPFRCAAMGNAALSVVRGRTHAAMHSARSAQIARAFEASRTTPPST